MKRNLTKLATVAALAAGMAFAQTPGTQQPRPGRGGQMARAMGQRVLRNLNLTDAQKEQVKAIFQEARQLAQPLRDQVKQNRQALSAAVKNNDTAQIQQRSIEAGNLQGQLLAIRSAAKAKVYALLTPEQKAQADQAQQQFRQRMQQRMQRRAGQKNG